MSTLGFRCYVRTSTTHHSIQIWWFLQSLTRKSIDHSFGVKQSLLRSSNWRSRELLLIKSLFLFNLFLQLFSVFQHFDSLKLFFREIWLAWQRSWDFSGYNWCCWWLWKEILREWYYFTLRMRHLELWIWTLYSSKLGIRNNMRRSWCLYKLIFYWFCRLCFHAQRRFAHIHLLSKLHSVLFSLPLQYFLEFGIIIIWRLLWSWASDLNFCRFRSSSWCNSSRSTWLLLLFLSNLLLQLKSILFSSFQGLWLSILLLFLISMKEVTWHIIWCSLIRITSRWYWIKLLERLKRWKLIMLFLKTSRRCNWFIISLRWPLH